jgi:hypothetical protein
MSSFFISLVLLDRHARTCYNKVSASYARALWNFNGSVQGSSCRLRKELRSSFDFFNPKQEVHFQSTFSKQNSIRNQFILFAWSNQKPRSHGTTTSCGLGASCLFTSELCKVFELLFFCFKALIVMSSIYRSPKFRRKQW